MTTSSSYEFNTSQNDIFQDLAKKMNFFGLLLLISGVISLLIGILVTFNLFSIQIEDIFLSSGINGILEGVFLLLIGIWTRKAAVGFSRIFKTTNNDIENLMNAMSELRKLYTLKYFLAIITVVFISLVFIVGIIGGITGALS